MSAGRSRVNRPRITRNFNVRLPGISLTRVRKNPKGWGNTEITLRTRAEGGVASLSPPPPYPPKPAEFTGTEPEWAVMWALLSLGLVENEDFYYLPRFDQGNINYFTTLDFYIPDAYIGIEVQGEYWHYEQGPERILRDITRQQVLAEYGIHVVHIDAEDATSNPKYYVQEALNGRDHSVNAGGTF